jgi:ribosome biogenesis GTPase A
MAKSRNLPGVTRQLQWVRIGGVESSEQENTIELLDSPGIIPAQQINQLNAIKLAICNDIGEASYDRVVIATHMCDLMNELNRNTKSYINMKKINDRYGFSFDTMTGEEIVYKVAENVYSGNLISAADKLLGDFRKGFMGSVSLESAPLNNIPMQPTPRHSKLSFLRKNQSATKTSITNDDDDGDDEEFLSHANNVSDSVEDGNNHINNDSNDGERAFEQDSKKTLSKGNLDIGKGNYEGW